MRIGRWRRWRWMGGGAKEKRRIGEEEEGGGIEYVGRRLTWLTTWSNFSQTSVLILASSNLLSARKAVKF